MGAATYTLIILKIYSLIFVQQESQQYSSNGAYMITYL